MKRKTKALIAEYAPFTLGIILIVVLSVYTPQETISWISRSRFWTFVLWRVVPSMAVVSYGYLILRGIFVLSRQLLARFEVKAG